MMRWVVLALTVLTGFSGLVYEVTWERVLATLLGSHGEAVAAVLGLFLGGLALGYALFGRFTQWRLARAAAAAKPPRLLFAYGLLEASIGLFALFFPFFFEAIQALSFAIPHGSAPLGFALDVLLSALLIGPPAILMGGTIPILTQALARDLQDATRVHAFVYGFNTAGAFVGALAAGFWIVPALGLVGSLTAMGLVNLVAGAAFLCLGWRPEPVSSGPSSAVAPFARATASDFPACVAAALLIGFAMMVVQTALNRLGALSFGASQFTFSMVVAVFVLCIALGSLAVSALPRVPRWLLAADLWALALLLALLYPRLPDAPYWAHLLRVRFPQDPAAFYPYHLFAFLGVLGVIGLPVALSGAALPLLFDHLRNRAGELGNVAGRLYSWNTVGSLLGALGGGYVLLYWLDLHHVFRLALLALVGAAVLVTQLGLAAPRRRLVAVLLLPVLALLVALPAWEPGKLSWGLFRRHRAGPSSFDGLDALFAQRAERSQVRFYDDDPVASIAVLETASGRGGRRDLSLVTNGKPDGALLGDYSTMALTALLPALMTDRVEKAFVIGYGTGVTVGTLASLQSVREITVAELSPAVMEAAPIFESGNGGALAFPDIRVVRSDAYRALMRSDERFDVIVSEPSNPWMTGVEMLYSREFLQATRERLAPGGVHCQWFHVYESDAATVRMVLRTYASVFDHVSVWYGEGPDLLILGLTDPETALDVGRIAARVQRPDYAAALRRAGIRSLPALLAHEILPLGVVHALDLAGEVHTLLHPRLSHLAARAFFVGRKARVPISARPETASVGDRNSLLGRYLALHEGQIPVDERGDLVTETCRRGRVRECKVLLAHWKHDMPDLVVRVHHGGVTGQESTSGGDSDFELIEMLSRLYGEATVAEEDAGGPVEHAWRTTALFTEYYHHGVPFSRGALAKVWRGCLEAAPERCRRAYAQASSWIGDGELGSSEARPRYEAW